MSRRRRGGRTNVGDHIGALVFGGILGAMGGGLATLWFTPWSGEELRARLFGSVARTGSPVVERVTFTAAPVASKASVTAQKGLDRVAPVVSKAADAAHKGVDRVAPAVDSAVDKVAEVAQRGAEIGSGAVHTATEQVRSVANRGEDQELQEPRPDAEVPPKPLNTL